MTKPIPETKAAPEVLKPAEVKAALETMHNKQSWELFKAAGKDFLGDMTKKVIETVTGKGVGTTVEVATKIKEAADAMKANEENKKEVAPVVQFLLSRAKGSGPYNTMLNIVAEAQGIEVNPGVPDSFAEKVGKIIGGEATQYVVVAAGTMLDNISIFGFKPSGISAESLTKLIQLAQTNILTTMYNMSLTQEELNAGLFIEGTVQRGAMNVRSIYAQAAQKAAELKDKAVAWGNGIAAKAKNGFSGAVAQPA